jgi:hypothetical protein
MMFPDPPLVTARSGMRKFVRRSEEVPRAVLPTPVYRQLAKWQGGEYSPQIGDLRRLAPTSRHSGHGHGRPVDLRYSESFLKRHATGVRQRVLEVCDDGHK